jgi:iron complex outermembrane receptor protein
MGHSRDRKLVSAVYLASAAPLVLLAAPGAQAQETELRLEEVVVTARKREESLLDIPESVSVISGLEMDRQNIRDLNKVGLTVPNLNLSARTDGFPNVSIRGIGAFGLTQGVGFYLDDVQLFGDASSRFGDLQRLEVLKGPQGVLYGGSNIGGAVKFVSEKPSPDEFSGRAKFQAGEQNIADGELALNMPLGDTWAMRVFGFARTDDGFITNPNSPSPVFGVRYNQPRDVGAYDEAGGRVSIAGDITDRLSLYASVRYNDFEGPGNTWARELSSTDFAYPKTLDGTVNPTLDRDTTGAHLEFTYSFDNMDLTSITSYTDTNSTRVSDVDLTPLWFFNTYQPQEMQVTTQEFRFTSTGDGPWQWIGGLYYMEFEESMRSYLDFGWIAVGGDDPTVGVIVPFETRDDTRSNLAGYANVTYEMDKWEFSAGLRVDQWKSDEIVLDIGHAAEKDEVEYVPRVAISRDVGDGMFYGSIARGFEPGGFNSIAFGAPPVFGPNGEKTLAGYDPEFVLQYELGWKGTFWDGRASADVAIFYSNYEDRQFEFILPNPGGEGLIEGITNVGDSTQMGIEASGSFQVTEYLTLVGAVGFIDAEFDSGTVLIDGTDISGNEPPNIITPSAALSANYRRPAMGSFDFVFNGQVSYNGETRGGAPWNNVTNPEYTVVNLQTGFVNEQWEIMLNVENLFDEEYYVDLQPFPNFGIDGLTGEGPPSIVIGTWGQPQLVTASVSYSF